MVVFAGFSYGDYMIVVSSGGVTYKHEIEVAVGAISSNIYLAERKIFITAVYNLQVEFYRMDTPECSDYLYKSDFYSRFERVQ